MTSSSNPLEPATFGAKDILYPTIISSAIRPVSHGPDLLIPSPPDTLDNILDDLDQISHISSDSDDFYDPGTNEPELFSQSDLKDLLRDLGLPKNTAEDLGSRLIERHLLNSSVSFSWYRFREKEFETKHYVKQTWPIRKALIPEVKNVERQSKVDPKKILFPPLHIKLGLIKQFVKALDKEGECCKYLCEQFPGLSNAKLKEVIFVGPDIRKLLKDETFVTKMEMKEKKIAWNSFKLVATVFLGNKKDPNYKALVAELLQNYKILGCNMSVKVHFLHSHLDLGLNFEKPMLSLVTRTASKMHGSLMPSPVKAAGGPELVLQGMILLLFGLCVLRNGRFLIHSCGLGRGL
ncbi:uncharacterized protein TNCV_14681 [Trichonephila clavipes]|nr:uncharacterized protein TNCV_14681 [Trichonephila clavipes]